MKLASTWMMTAAGAAVVAFVGTRPLPLRSPRLEAGMVDVADVASEGDAAPAFPPQPRDDQAAYLQQMVNELRQENQQLRRVDDQVGALRQDMADRQAEREYEAEAVAAHQDAVLELVDRLRQDEEALAAGDTEGVSADLVYAESLLSGSALFEVQAAREALRREDLYPARQHLAAAIALGSPAQ